MVSLGKDEVKENESRRLCSVGDAVCAEERRPARLWLAWDGRRHGLVSGKMK
jgi:hypothetical protein